MDSLTHNKDRLTHFLLAVIAVVAVGLVLKFSKPVILPLLIAWLLSFVFGAAVDRMARYRIPRTLTIFLMLVTLFGVGYVGSVFLTSQVSSIARALPRYQERFVLIVGDILTRFDIAASPLADVNWRRALEGFLVSISGSLLSILINLVLVLAFMVFILMGQPRLGAKITHAFPGELAQRIVGTKDFVSSQITRYLSAQFLISLATGILVWLALTLLEIDFALTWGALAFFLNFVPTIGSIVASVPPILLAFIQFYPNILHGVLTLVALILIQNIIGTVISPKVLGDRLDLSPIVVLGSLLFWGLLWGVVGALLSVVLASAIKIVCDQIDLLRPVGVMMGSGKKFKSEIQVGKP